MSDIHSVVYEIKQQLTRSYALVASARSALIDGGADPQSIPVTLLDMAEDDLSNVSAIQSLSRQVGCE